MCTNSAPCPLFELPVVNNLTLEGSKTKMSEVNPSQVAAYRLAVLIESLLMDHIDYLAAHKGSM